MIRISRSSRVGAAMRPAPVLCLLTVLFGIACFAGASEPAVSDLSIEKFRRGPLRADDIQLTIDHGRDRGPGMDLKIEKIAIDAFEQTINNLHGSCDALELNLRSIRCERLELALAVNEQIYSLTGSVEYKVATGMMRAQFARPGDDATQITVILDSRGNDRRLEVEVDAQQLEIFSDMLPEVDIYAGALKLALGFYPGLHPRLDTAIGIRGLAWSNGDGTRAAEDLSIDLKLELDSVADAYRGGATLSLVDGAVYAEPFYVEFSANPLVSTADIDLKPASGTMNLASLVVDHRDVFRVVGDLSFSSSTGVDAASLRFEQIEFPAAYETWAAGVAVGTPLANLDTSGNARGRVQITDGNASSASFDLEDLSAEDRDGRFALYDLNATLNWAADGLDLAASTISFAGGHIYGASFDRSELVLGIAGEAIDLLEPVRIAALGGGLAITTFALRDYGGDDIKLRFEAELDPIDLGQLTLALDWPAFSGSLSGRLPLLRYENGVVIVGGNLEARAFDGDITVAGLTIRQPFGLIPEIEATVKLRNLDLEQVTQVVPFGRVSGRLDGDIVNLHLLKGQPVAFNARFGTPEDDRSKRRLSQRAVDTISRVAGGGAALSTTFLRVFKHFAYDKLGISCRLEDDICHMDGIEDADAGYYIVKGAMIPRVDLIGRVRQVQWSRLMQQLERALNEGEFKIE